MSTNERGLSSDVDFQFYTHRSVQDSEASRYFQTVAELRFSVYDLCPSKPRPFAQIKIDASAHV